MITFQITRFIKLKPIHSLSFSKFTLGESAESYRRAFLDSYETEYDKTAFDRLEDVLHVWYGLDYMNFSAATPNYHHQLEAIKKILQKSLANSGIVN